MGDHHDFINSGSWWKVSSSSSISSSSSMRANSIESGGSAAFHDKLHHSLATDHHLQMIGLGLSSQSHVDQWNQSLLGDSKAETSFGVMLQENINLDATSNANANTTSYQLQESDPSHHQALWRDPRINNSDFKPQLNMTSSNNRGFFLDHQFSPHGSSSTDSSTVTCQGFSSDNPSNTLYGPTATTPNSSSAMFHHHHHHQAAGFNMPGSSDQQPSRTHQASNLGYSQFGSSTGNYDQTALRFSNNATFWNPTAAGNVGPTHHDASSNYFPALQPPQIHAPSFDEQPNGMSEIKDSSSSEVKRVGGDQPAAKRAKSEATSPSPPLKVKKEKMSDRIAALQQLVSPFGKTDQASVLSEAIEYIKFLHQQVSALSNPYMNSGASLQHQQSDHPKELEVSKEPDLRSQGLCLVPVSSTFPVTHDTTVDFWTTTFGGTFR
ncbi:transcription factor bHLH123-like isoform X2 [Brassica napus]|uniref:transcription factor bHLH123-like isoform X2 n=1 Tax=Brassica oleracea var. oleracea TaxID=109376 RepID=UPI0006A735E0|nr:PREDICTED: transcription factor bHLH123-like isoform X2 [Brassica oleracea var. oleracea]XP_013639696.1 PREDICTED: transcription factor bHLH123-like isoform X2 [Brassica oleracea var. oleracea]XP_048600441.1 transcription factor bHLH123-like isoform X2 [Brassica napus]